MMGAWRLRENRALPDHKSPCRSDARTSSLPRRCGMTLRGQKGQWRAIKAVNARALPLNLPREPAQFRIPYPPRKVPYPPLAEERSPVLLLRVVLLCRTAARRDGKTEALAGRSGREVHFGDKVGEAGVRGGNGRQVCVQRIS